MNEEKLKSNDPNKYQIGGDHYKMEYQHWDFVSDTNTHYLLGCATKYIARYKKKYGTVDLEKAIHYLVKAERKGVYSDIDDKKKRLDWIKFYTQLDSWQQAVMICVYSHDYDEAIRYINEEIDRMRKESNNVK